MNEKATITQEQYNTLLSIQQEILSMIASHGNYTNILARLCTLAESSLPNSVASIMLLNNDTGLMSVLSAPSIPAIGHKALENLKPGPGGGSCGNAVFCNQAQYVLDTFKDPRWVDIRQVAHDFNLCSCWSMPVQNEDGEAIGTFALSSFEHRSPSLFHKKLLESAVSIVNIVLRNQDNDTKLNEMLYQDLLTKLHNKAYLENTISNTKIQTLLLLNVNRFSYINTSYGFETGDKILIELAKILQTNFNAKVVSRINSDEFALLYDGGIDIKMKINEIQNYFDTYQLQIDNIYLHISFSFGTCTGNENLIRNAALALKQAKKQGENMYYIYSENDDNTNPKKRESFIARNNQLHIAFSEDRIVPHFQGIRDNLSKKIKKYEVLARIEENGQIISPFVFLEPARLAGMLPQITKIMIDKSFKIMQSHTYTFSINITEEDLSLDYLIQYLEEKSKEYNIKKSRIILEILEGISADGKKSHVKQLKELKSLGYSLAIDDFGTEYSNFERVLDLDIDFLKIDAKYIKDIHTNKKSYEIARAIAFFAKNANIPCIAEFVHNEEVQAIIDTLDIEYSQGYLFSEPSVLL